MVEKTRCPHTTTEGKVYQLPSLLTDFSKKIFLTVIALFFWNYEFFLLSSKKQTWRLKTKE